MAWWKHLEKIEWEKKTMECGKQAGQTFEKVKKKGGGDVGQPRNQSVAQPWLSVDTNK